MTVEHVDSRHQQRADDRCRNALHSTTSRISALLLAVALALPLFGCGSGPDGSSEAPSAPLPTPIDLEAIPYETRLAQDITTLDAACAGLMESLTELEADPAKLDAPLWTIELETSATEVWASTLVILARETVPERWTELHAELLEPARVVNTSAESVLYPASDSPQRTPTSLLTLRPAFGESCAQLVESAQPIVAGVEAGQKE